MSDFKKAFLKLDKEKMPEGKKQLIFDNIMEESHKAKSRRSVFTIAAAAAAAFVIAAAAFVMPKMLSPRQYADEVILLPDLADEALEEAVEIMSGPQVVSTIVMSLNPVVRFDLDAQGNVVELSGVDEDGTKLLTGIDCTGLSLENAAIVVVNQLLLNDYISSGVEQEEIMLSIESEQISVEHLSVVTETIKTAAKQHNIDVDVTESEDNQQLSIVLTGEEETGKTQTPAGGEVTLEFELSGQNSGLVDDVKVYSADSDMPLTGIDFAGMTYKEAALFGVSELIENGFLSNEQTASVLLKLSAENETMKSSLAFLAEQLMLQAGINFEVVSDEMGLVLRPALIDTEPEQPAFSMAQILDPTVHKAKEELTKTQMGILEFVYTSEQIDELLAIRYWVVVPNLIGLEEDKAVEMLKQMGIVPVVTIEYNEQYASDISEGQVYFQDMCAGSLLEKGDRFQVFVLGNNISPLGENWTPSVYNETADAGAAEFETEYEAYISATQDIYIVLSNLSEETGLDYDADFTLERLYENEWYAAVCSDCYEPAVRSLEPLGIEGIRIDLSFAGELEDGHYRIVKQLGETAVSAEFDIDEDGYDSERISGYAPITELPEAYAFETAQANGDFIIGGDTAVYNEHSLLGFFEKAELKIPCMVRRSVFDAEGKAEVADFIFDGEHYLVRSMTENAETSEKIVSEKHYSYITLECFGGNTAVELTNSYDRVPQDSEYVNVDRCVLLNDTASVQSFDVAQAVEALMDEDAPLKVYSPDGLKYVSFADGGRTVNYQGIADGGRYAGGIVLPEETGIAQEIIALEWRDISVAVITYRTIDNEFNRLAYDVEAEAFAELTEPESEGLGRIEQEYFTDADFEVLKERFANGATAFELLVTDADGTEVYALSRAEAAAETEGETGQAELVLDEQTWSAFIHEALDCNVLEWNRLYTGTERTEQWTLTIYSADAAVVCKGSADAPEEFEQLLEVVNKYFKPENTGDDL